MKILAAARHPGPAEAIGSVVRLLRDSGHEVLLIGVLNDTPATKVHGGSSDVFRRIGVSFHELSDLDFDGDVTDVPGEFAARLIDAFFPDRIVVGCSLDVSGTHMGIEEASIEAGVRGGPRNSDSYVRWTRT